MFVCVNTHAVACIACFEKKWGRGWGTEFGLQGGKVSDMQSSLSSFQEYIGNSPPILVVAVGLKGDFPAEHYLRRSLLAVFLLRQRTLRRRVY
jgi:hypothetical protein